MANALYDTGRNAFLTKLIDWTADTIKVTLIDSAGYTADTATDQYMNTDTIPASAKIATGTLDNCSASAGVADADDEVLSTVSGAESEALVIWMDGGDAGTTASGTNDMLIAYIDTATGLPVTPNGGDITISWSTAANKIFKL